MNNTRTSSARALNRRNQPRTVEAGRPNATAIGRWPEPVALASNADPITAAESARRANQTAGNNTCVLAQPEQDARRGRCRTLPCSCREVRQRA